MSISKKSSSKLVYILIAVIAFGFIYTLLAPAKKMPSNNTDKLANNDTELKMVETPPNTLILGRVNAPVTLVEYIDYKCPNCGEFHTKAGKQIQQEYVDAGIVKIELRAYPFLGPDSARALRGAYCANDLGKLRKYHDNVFNFMWENYYKNGDFKVEIENILTSDKLVDIFASDEIQTQTFKDCINSEVKNEFIDRDLERAAKDDVQGTPTIIISDKKVVGPQPFNIYKQLIDIQNQ